MMTGNITTLRFLVDEAMAMAHQKPSLNPNLVPHGLGRLSVSSLVKLAGRKKSLANAFIPTDAPKVGF